MTSKIDGGVEKPCGIIPNMNAIWITLSKYNPNLF
jgi:hypothetical protein